MNVLMPVKHFGQSKRGTINIHHTVYQCFPSDFESFGVRGRVYVEEQLFQLLKIILSSK